MDSLNEQVEKVREAFFVANTPQIEMPTETPYVCEVFDGYVIAEVDDKKYQINYTTDADGVITFDPRESWVEVEEVYQPAKSDSVVNFGSEVKALGDGKIGGVLVRMSTQNDPDLTNDFFSAKSDIRFPETIDVYYNHGLDATIKSRVIGKAKLSRLDNADIWAETQLNMRDDYEKRIYAMAEAGKLGYSSGALSHLVEREPVGKSFHIKTWVIGEASLTPTPAEYRNTVQPIKSIQDADKAAKEKLWTLF